MKTHETVLSFRKVTLGSNRKFGFAFSALFMILGLWPLFRHAGSPRWSMIIISLSSLTVALLFPRLLTPLNRGWFKLGIALNRIVNPVVMGILFFGAVVPLGWYLRKRGEDLLRLKIRPDATTYWIERHPPGPVRGTLTKQY
jgi:Saxitoxin biosynthesis operon protein SxtJ